MIYLEVIQFVACELAQYLGKNDFYPKNRLTLGCMQTEDQRGG